MHSYFWGKKKSLFCKLCFGTVCGNNHILCNSRFYHCALGERLRDWALPFASSKGLWLHLACRTVPYTDCLFHYPRSTHWNYFVLPIQTAGQCSTSIEPEESHISFLPWKGHHWILPHPPLQHRPPAPIFTLKLLWRMGPVLNFCTETEGYGYFK